MRTEVLHGQKKVLDAMGGFLRNAKSRMDLCAGIITSRQNPGNESLTRAYFDLARKGVRLRVIGEITKDRIGQARELMKSIEVRNLGGVKSYFGVSDSEYVAIPGKEDFNPKGPLLYSNEEPFVRHHQALFDMLWERAVPADVRIEELEKGEETGETRITFSTEEIMESARQFVDGMKEEALVLISREGGFKDNLGLFRRIARRASETGAKVRVLGRFLGEEEEVIKRFQAEGFEFKSLSPGRVTNLSLGIYDRKEMGFVEYRYPGMTRPAGRSYLTGVISTHRLTVAGLATIFDSLWEESELRQEAELMRDIVTHDIGNYNQIFMSNAEVLREKLGGDSRARSHADAILRAIDGATGLVENTRMLGKIVADKGPALRSTNLLESLERSLRLVERANPDKVVQVSKALPSDAWVTADSLLDQVFVNIFSNAIRYTDGDKVQLGLRVASNVEAGAKSRRQSYWKVEVTDHGRGMPEDLKANAAFRYKGARAAKGLGLSIVRALAVDRYSGRLDLTDRVRGDRSKGTRVVVSIPRAASGRS